MEAARIVSTPQLRFSGAGDGGRLILRRRGNSGICFSVRDNDTLILRKEFSDSGHTQYYQPPVTESGKKQKAKMREILTEKKKTKLIKRLSKDLDLFSQSANTEEIGSRSISEAAEVLLAELENLRTAEKEQKRNKKEEKTKSAKSKAMMESDTSSSSSSSSSSESSDCDEDKVVNLRRLRVNSQPQITENKPDAQIQQLTLPTTSNFVAEDRRFTAANEICSIESAAVSSTKIEVCMGGKCKKLGAPMLMEEFEREIGSENSVVVGCKCMGKCKSGPNVRVSNSVTEIQEENVKSSVKTTTNPLYIGVGLEDVAAIVANLLGENGVGEGLLAAS